MTFKGKEYVGRYTRLYGERLKVIEAVGKRTLRGEVTGGELDGCRLLMDTSWTVRRMEEREGAQEGGADTRPEGNRD